MDYDGFRKAGGDVSRETFEALNHFAELLVKWNRKINLISPATIPDLWTRHILDSLQLVRLAPESAQHWADLGSGGGLPGLVVAISRRDWTGMVTLVESDLRKATFLRTVIRELKLPANVVSSRIETLESLGADVISARALAPLAQLLRFQELHSAPGGIGLYPKGVNLAVEMSEALEHWRFTCEKFPSTTAVGSHVLKIGDLTRA